MLLAAAKTQVATSGSFQPLWEVGLQSLTRVLTRGLPGGYALTEGSWQCVSRRDAIRSGAHLPAMPHWGFQGRMRGCFKLLVPVHTDWNLLRAFSCWSGPTPLVARLGS